MKSILITIAALVLAASSALASNFRAEQFITGSGLLITNQTYNYGDPGIAVYDYPAEGGLYNGQPLSIRYSLSSSNLVATIVSNSASGYSPGTLYYTNYQPYSAASPYAGGMTLNTNVVNGFGWVDVPAWCDSQGNPGQGCLSVTTIGTVANATNAITLVFSPVYNGTNNVSWGVGSVRAAGVDKITLTITAQGASSATAKTNLTSAFMAGARRIRLESIVATTSATGTPALIGNITASGWTSP